MPITIENAKVKKLIYYNNQNHWGVFSIQYIPEKSEDGLNISTETTVSGNFDGIYEGCQIDLVAEEVEHAKYGKQLQLQQYHIIEDNSSKESIVNFLTKSSINGIHKVLAERIYEEFKEDSINVVLHHTEKLKSIKGIGEKTYKVVKESVSTYFQMESLLKYCANIGLNKFSLIMQLFNEFGEEAVSILKENPYQLLVMSENLTFNQVDEIAMKSGIPADDDNRLKYGFIYVLNRESVLRGSTGCPDIQLKQVFLKTLGLQNSQLYRYMLTTLTQSGDVFRDDDNVYLNTFYNAEKHIAHNLHIINNDVVYDYNNEIINEELNAFEFTLNDDQLKAVSSCLKHQFSVITSLAGCGKSTISKAIINILQRHGKQICLIAPTAKAAKRLTECTGHEAQTIHRFLKIKDSTLTSYEEVIVPRNTLILIDEASMVDVRLFDKVLNVLKSDTQVILVGDTHQLPSVQAGNLLEDIINSYKERISISIKEMKIKILHHVV